MTATIASLVADHLDLWTSATQRKSGAGRGAKGVGGKRIRLYGIERLRALILDLAVRGKLVPQDTGDEPASTYLVTASQRVDAASAKGRRKQILPSPDESLELPSGWSPTHLGSIVDIVRGITFPGSEKSKTPEFGRVACLRTSNVQDQIEWDDILYIRDKFVARADQYVQKNDIIISMANSRELVGKVAIIERDPETPTAFGGFLAAIRARSVDPGFLMTFLRCPATKAQLIDDASQTTNIANISLSKLNPLPIPLPPLAEQRRIVAKVDELMALCDALERESADAMAAHQALVEALLTTLVTSADAAELATNWARLEQHFDTLFTTEASIDALKQTILDLAVRGALVAGVEAKDKSRSAVDLASKAKKAMSTAEGLRARTPVARDKLARPEDTFPSHWTFTDFDSVFVTVSGVTKGQKISPSEAIEAPYLRVANVQRGQLDLDEMKTITVKHSDFKRYQLHDGDVLMTEGGDWDKLGRAAIWRNEVPNCIHQNHVFRVRFEQNAILPEWVVLFVNSPLGREFFSRAAKQTTNLASINMTQLRSCPIPIPAYTEQHRIVAKVDALMALCDALKARISDAATTQKHLADAITERAAA